MAYNLSKKEKTRFILENLSCTSDKYQSFQAFRNYVLNNRLEILMNHKSLDFKYELKVLKSFKKTISEVAELDPKVLIREIVKILEGDFKEAKIHHRHYYRIKIKLSNLYSLLAYAGSIKTYNTEQATPCVVLIGIFNESTYREVKNMFKNSGIMFQKQGENKTASKKQEQLIPGFKKIIKELITTHQLLIHQFWEFEGINIKSPKIFLIYYFGLLLKNKKGIKYEYNENQIKVLNLNPFKSYGLPFNISCSNACYKMLKNEFYKELLIIVDKYCSLLLNKSNLSFKGVKAYPYVMILKNEKIHSKIVLCVYISCDSLSNPDRGTQYVFDYRAELITDTIINKIPKRIKRMNDEIENLHKNQKIPYIMSVIDETKDKLNFKALNEYSYYLDEVKIYLAIRDLYNIEDIRITMEKRELNLTKFAYDASPEFSVFHSAAFLIPNTTIKIIIKAQGINESMNAYYSGGEALFIVKHLEGNTFDYKSFKFFVQFIVNNNYIQFMGSLMNSTQMQKHELINYYKSYLDEKSSLPDGEYDVIFLVLADFFELKNLELTYKMITLSLLVKFSSIIKGIEKEYRVNLFEYFTKLFIEFSNLEDQGIIDKLDIIIHNLNEANYKELLTKEICKLLIKDSNINYNKNLAFIEDSILGNENPHKDEILFAMITKSNDFLTMIKSYAFMNGNKIALEKIRFRFDNLNSKTISLNLKDLNEILEIINKFKDLSHKLQDLNGEILQIISNSIKSCINEKKISLIETLNNSNDILFFKCEALKKHTKQKIFQELLLTGCFEIRFYEFFKNYFENITEFDTLLSHELVNIYIKDWVYYFKNTNINLIKETIIKLSGHSTFTKLSQVICDALTDRRDYENISKNSNIDILECDIFSHIDLFYEFIKYPQLLENYKKKVMTSITFDNYQHQLNTFKDLKKEIKDSEIGALIVYGIASVYPIPTDIELEKEFCQYGTNNELFIYICNIKANNLNENLIKLRRTLFNYIKQFFINLEQKNISVNSIKNLQNESYFKKISIYFDFYFNHFKPTLTNKNMLNQLCGDYSKVKAEFEIIKKLFDFLRNNDINTDKYYHIEFDSLTSDLEQYKFIDYKVPKNYEKLIFPAYKLIKLNCNSKIENIMIKKFAIDKKFNLDEIVNLIDSEYENLEKNCNQISCSTLDTTLSDLLPFLTIFDNYEDLVRLFQEMNMKIPEFVKKAFNNLKIKDYFEKVCNLISNHQGLFEVEKNLTEKCAYSASLLSKCAELSLNKLIEIFEVEKILTDFTEIEEKKAYYNTLEAIDKHKEIIIYLINNEELSDPNIFEELIIEINDQIIRKVDKYDDKLKSHMNMELTPEIISDFKNIRKTFSDIGLKSFNYETLKLKLQKSKKKNLKITKMLEANQKFFKCFKDMIYKNFHNEIYFKNKISSICNESTIKFVLEKLSHSMQISSEGSEYKLLHLIDMKERVLLEKNSLYSNSFQIQNENFSNFISFVENLEEISQKHERALILGVSFPSVSFSIHYVRGNIEKISEYNKVFQLTLENIEKQLDTYLEKNYSFTFATSTNFRLIEDFLIDIRSQNKFSLKLMSLISFISPYSARNQSILAKLNSISYDFKRENTKNQIDLNSIDENLKFEYLSFFIKDEFKIKLDYIQKFLNIVCTNDESISNSNNSGIFRCKTDDTKMALLTIFLNLSEKIPFCNQFLHCKSSTEWADLKTFTFRCLKAPIGKIFALIEPENLKLSVQKKLIDFISRFYEKKKMKRMILYIITSVSSNPVTDYLKSCSRGLNEYQITEAINSKKIRKIVPGLSEIRCFYSVKSGTGKSSLIKNTLVGRLFYFELRISGNFNESVLEIILDLETFSKACLYHIVLAVTEKNQDIYDFLYYFIVFRCVFFKGAAFFIHSDSKICIEIEEIKSFDRICSFFPLLKFTTSIEVDFNDLASKLQIDSKMENVSRMKYLLIKKKLDDKTLDIPIERQILASTILNDIISQEQDILNNFYQINQYFSILDFIFSNFRNSIYNTDACSALIEELEKHKQTDLSIYLKNQKTLIVSEIFKTIRNFCSRLDNPDNENDDEDPEICKKWKEIYILFIYFNTSGSLFVLTDDNSKYPEDLKVISTIQNAYAQDSMENKNLNRLSRIFKSFKGFDYDKLKAEIKNKKFIYKTIEKTDESLFQNLIEITDRPISRDVSAKDSDEFKDYVLSLDNLIKMVLIYIRSKAGLPIIIMGDSGCGKTALIKYFATYILKQKFLNYSINAGTDLEMVDKYITDIKNESKKLRESGNGKSLQLWVFFDEFNTSECVSYFSQILIEKRFKNEELPSNIIWVGACNPCKLRKANEDEYALPKSVKQNVKNLVHNVKKLPLKILEHIWDFGSLEKHHLMRYISSITQKIFRQVVMNKYLLESIKIKSNQLIFSAHEFHLEYEGGSSVSLRDVSRFTDLSIWFNKYQDFFFNQSSSSSSEMLDSSLFKSCVLAFLHCYYLRISSNDLRKRFLEQSAKLIETKSDFFINIMKKAQSFIMDQIEIPEGIAKNSAIMENIYSIIPCICNKISIYMCGKPGSSKSLSAACVFNSMKGKNSESEFFRKLPEIFQIYYQGSDSSTSKEIETIFEKANDYKIWFEEEKSKKEKKKEGIKERLKKELSEKVISKKKKSKKQSKKELSEKEISKNEISKSEISKKELSEKVISRNESKKESKNESKKELSEKMISKNETSKKELWQKVRSKKDISYKNISETEILEKIPVILFDEMGLAELSVHNPLKVIHKYLEHENKNFGFIGISNWKMDTSKMNRTLYLNRIVPECYELEEIAENIYSSFKLSPEPKEVDIVRRSAKIYHLILESLKYNQSFRNFYGLRDFYGTIKYMCRAFKNSQRKDYWEIIIKAFFHNFGGTLGIYQKLMDEYLNQNFKEFFFKEHKIPKTLELIGWSLADENSRFIMAISNTDVALFLLKNHVKRSTSTLTILVGSQFELDKQSDQHLSKKISEISNYLKKDTTLILTGLKGVYSSLYELLNQTFKVIGSKKYCKLTIGTSCNYRTHVHDNLKIIIVEDESDKHLSSIDPPFLNRFEKYRLDLNEIMTESQKNHAEEHESLIKTLYESRQGGVNITQEIIFPICNPLNLKFMALNQKSLNFSECCCIDIILKNSSADIHYMLNDGSIRSKDLIEKLEKIHQTTIFEDLEIILKQSAGKCSKLLALTYDTEELNNEYLKKNGVSRKITDFSREYELRNEIILFFKEQSEIFILEIDFNENHNFLFQVISILDCFINEYIKENAKLVVILVRLSRNDRERHKLIYEPSWDSKMYDSLNKRRSSYIDNSIKYSQELIFKEPDYENKLRNEIIYLINKSFFCIKFNRSISEFNFKNHRNFIIEKFKSNDQLCEYFCSKVISILKKRFSKKNHAYLIENILFQNNLIKMEATSTFHALELIKMNELFNCVLILVLNLEYYSSFTSFSRDFSEDFSKIIDPVIEKIIEESDENLFGLQLYQNNVTVIDNLHFPFIKRLYLKSLNLISNKEDDSIKLLKHDLFEFNNIFEEIKKRELIENYVSDLFEIICEEVNLKYEKTSLIQIIINYLIQTNDMFEIICFINSKKSTILHLLSLDWTEKINIFDEKREFQFSETKELFNKYQENKTWETLLELLISNIVSQCICNKNILFGKDRFFAITLFRLLEKISKNETINKTHIKNLKYIYELISINSSRLLYFYSERNLKSYKILDNISSLTEITQELLNNLNQFEDHQKFIFLSYFHTLKLKPEIIEKAPLLYSLSQTGKIIYSVDILNWILKETEIIVKLNEFKNQICTEEKFLILEQSNLMKNLEKAVKTSSNFKFMFMNQLHARYFNSKERSNFRDLCSNSSEFLIKNAENCKKLLQATDNSMPELFTILKLLNLKQTLEIFLEVLENLSNYKALNQYLNTIQDLFNLKPWKDLIYSFLFKRLNNLPRDLQELLKNKNQLKEMHDQINKITKILDYKPLAIFENKSNKNNNLIIDGILILDGILRNHIKLNVDYNENLKIFLNLKDIFITTEDLYKLLKKVEKIYDQTDFPLIRYSIIIVYCSPLIMKRFIGLEKVRYTSLLSYFKNHIYLVSILIMKETNENIQNECIEEINLKMKELKNMNPFKNIQLIFMCLLNELINLVIKNHTIHDILMSMKDENYRISQFHSIIDSYSYNVINAVDNRKSLTCKQFLIYYFRSCLIDAESLFTQNFNRKSFTQSDLISQVDEKLYPLVKVFFNFEAEISALNNLSSVIIFLNHLLRIFSYKLTRSEAKVKKLDEIFIKNYETEALFQKFEISLKVIIENLQKITLITNKPDIRELSSLSRHCTLDYFLIDENKNEKGIHLANLLKFMCQVHNGLAIILGKIKNEKIFNLENFDIKKYRIQKIYNKKINYTKHTINSICQKFSINDPSSLYFETFFDFESLENSLSGLFNIDEILETRQLDTIEYSNEIFNSSSKHKDLIQELRIKGYSEKLNESLKKQLIDPLKKIKQKSEILKLVFEMMIYINQVDCDTLKNTSLDKFIVGESGIRETLPNFIRTISIIKSIKVRNIVTVLEIIEETCFHDFTSWIINECKKETIKEEYVQKFFKYYNEDIHPSKTEIILALKRVMLRNLTSEIDISEPILGYLENRSVWEFSEEKMYKAEKMLVDCISADMPIENIYAFYKRLSN